MDYIIHSDKKYPLFQSKGFAAKFAFPFALEICKGEGFDIGCMKTEWALPGAMPIDCDFNDPWDAYNLPKDIKPDYIFSSHCLEHLPHWVDALDYWSSLLSKDGVIYLYLSDFSQTYWRPWYNRKHVHVLSPEITSSYFKDNNFSDIFTTGVDLNNSFTIVAVK